MQPETIWFENNVCRTTPGNLVDYINSYILKVDSVFRLIYIVNVSQNCLEEEKTVFMKFAFVLYSETTFVGKCI